MTTSEYIHTLKSSKNNNHFENFIKINSDLYKNKDLTNEVCVCHNIDGIVKIYRAKNNVPYVSTYTIRNKRKLYYILGEFPYIITNCNVNVPNAKIIREELVDNYIFNEQKYYFSEHCCYDKEDLFAYLDAQIFLSLANSKYLEQIIFNSMLLNYFTNGFVIDDVIIKPKINISKYGRWYWSNSDKIQTNLSERNKIYRKLSKCGAVINVDLVSAEPFILSGLSGSKVLKKLIDYRISLKNKNEEIRDILKRFINIFIHSYPTTNSVYQTVVRTIDNYKKLEDVIGIKIENIINKLFEEFSFHDKNIITEYRTKLEYMELQRRIINPYAPIQSDAQIIKEHRKYMQGHAHDLLLQYSYMNYKKLPIVPIFTIHDCLSYFIQDLSIIDNFIDVLKENAKEMKLSINLEIYKKMRSRSTDEE